MKNAWIIIAPLAFAALAQAEDFKSIQECVAGKRVVDMRNRAGSIVGVYDATRCTFRPDGGGGDEHLIFWMFHPEGASKETDDKLVPGVYECFGNGRYTFMDVRISGADTYEIRGTAGKFRLDPRSRMITFLSGPLVGSTSKLLQGPKIGLNRDGGSFFATTCELNKTKKTPN